MLCTERLANFTNFRLDHFIKQKPNCINLTWFNEKFKTLELFSLFTLFYGEKSTFRVDALFLSFLKHTLCYTFPKLEIERNTLKKQSKNKIQFIILISYKMPVKLRNNSCIKDTTINIRAPIQKKP